jgi:large subunit ribosomal protein L32
MGGVPKWNKTKARRNKRRMHLVVKAKGTTKCPKCAHPVLPHTVCKNCGFYKGKQIIDVLAKLSRKEKKQKEKEMKAQDKENKKEAKQEESSKK